RAPTIQSGPPRPIDGARPCRGSAALARDALEESGDRLFHGGRCRGVLVAGQTAIDLAGRVVEPRGEPGLRESCPIPTHNRPAFRALAWMVRSERAGHSGMEMPPSARRA